MLCYTILYCTVLYCTVLYCTVMLCCTVLRRAVQCYVIQHDTLLQLPGKKASGPGGWPVQAKVRVYLWLGLARHKADMLRGLPAGYQDNDDDDECSAIRKACNLHGVPPSYLQYTGGSQ